MMRHFTVMLCLVAMFALVAVPAMAKGSYLNEIKKKYPDPKIAKTLTCAMCHADMQANRSKMTLFGQDFKKQTGTTAEKIAKLEKLDSDKDTFSNLEEIKAGSNPSDPKITPKNVATLAKANAKTTGTLAKATTKTTGTLARTDTKTTKTYAPVKSTRIGKKTATPPAAATK